MKSAFILPLSCDQPFFDLGRVQRMKKRIVRQGSGNRMSLIHQFIQACPTLPAHLEVPGGFVRRPPPWQLAIDVCQKLRVTAMFLEHELEHFRLLGSRFGRRRKPPAASAKPWLAMCSRHSPRYLTASLFRDTSWLP